MSEGGINSTDSKYGNPSGGVGAGDYSVLRGDGMGSDSNWLGKALAIHDEYLQKQVKDGAASQSPPYGASLLSEPQKPKSPYTLERNDELKTTEEKPGFLKRTADGFYDFGKAFSTGDFKEYGNNPGTWGMWTRLGSNEFGKLMGMVGEAGKEDGPRLETNITYEQPQDEYRMMKALERFAKSRRRRY